MSTVAFWMFYELGHIYPTLRLARGIRDAGHRVVYFTIEDFEEKIRDLGFDVVTVLPKSIPRGTIPALHQSSGAELEALQGLITGNTLVSMLTDAVDDPLRSLAPDLLLYDTKIWGLAMPAWRWKIPCLGICTTMAGWAPGVPPLNTDLPFGDTRERLAEVEKAWDHAVHLWNTQPYKAEIDDVIKSLHRKYDYPESWIDHTQGFSPIMVRVPEMVLCSSALDYPRPPENRHYVESLDLDRESIDFPWDRLGERERLIFCSLGSQAYRIEGASRFFSQVLAAAAERPEWQFVVIVGTRLDPEDFEAPENALVVQYGPQIELIEKCDLVVTHAGLGTVKESLVLGKPLLAFPVEYDQPGNAARLAYHGLAEAGDYRTVTASELLAKADRVLGDPGLPDRLAAMQRAFVELEERRPGLALVERALREPAAIGGAG